MFDPMKWVDFHHSVKSKYLSIAPNLWWGDDLDVRFFLLKNLMKLKEQKILDIGSNIGITLSFLDRSNELYGVEIDDYCVNEARKLNPNTDIFHGSMEKLPYEDNSFDIVIMMNVLPYYDFAIGENIKETFIKNTFDEVYRVLKDDGTLYFTTPNGESTHYKNFKAKIEDVNSALNKFVFAIKGWNNLQPLFPFLPKRYKFIPPKVLCHFEFIWSRLLSNMDKDINGSKYFYLEAKKKIA